MALILALPGVDLAFFGILHDLLGLSGRLMTLQSWCVSCRGQGLDIPAAACVRNAVRIYLGGLVP